MNGGGWSGEREEVEKKEAWPPSPPPDPSHQSLTIRAAPCLCANKLHTEVRSCLPILLLLHLQPLILSQLSIFYPINRLVIKVNESKVMDFPNPVRLGISRRYKKLNPSSSHYLNFVLFTDFFKKMKVFFFTLDLLLANKIQHSRHLSAMMVILNKTKLIGGWTFYYLPFLLKP